MTQRAKQQKQFKYENSRPHSIREKDHLDESQGEFENDLGLSCRQTGIKTSIPGIAGGILAMQEHRGPGTQASENDGRSGRQFGANPRKGTFKGKKSQQQTLNSNSMA